MHEIFESQNLFGIWNPYTEEKIIPAQYCYIGTIKNYYDLSMKNGETVYLLYENDDDECRFCIINNAEPRVSKSKYHQLLYFYRGWTWCYRDEEGLLIDLDENIIQSYNAERQQYEMREDELGINSADFSDLVRLSQIFEDGDGSNFGYYISTETDCPLPKKMIYTPPVHLGPTSAERDLWNDLPDYGSLCYDSLEPFDYESGICIARKNFVEQFLNRYFYHVGNSFDYYYDSEEVIYELGLDNPGPDIAFVLKGTSILKLKLTGNFIEDYLKTPYLFFEFDSVYFTLTGTKIPTNEGKPNYWKADRYILEQLIEEDRFNNHDLTIDEDYINQLKSSDRFIQRIRDHLPFDLKKVISISNTDDTVKKHNELFGIIYSTYEVLEEYSINSTEGALKFDLGNYKAAVELLTIDLKAQNLTEEERAELLFYRGLSFLSLNSIDEALKDLTESGNLNPYSKVCFYNKALAEYRLGYFQDSVTSFNKVEDLLQDLKSSNKDMKILLYINRAKAKLELIDTDGASNDLNLALELNERSPEIYLFRGKLKEMLLNDEGALKEYRKGQDLSAWYIKGDDDEIDGIFEELDKRIKILEERLTRPDNN
jgi:tetratricopeptide (TPR) repeat protein